MPKSDAFPDNLPRRSSVAGIRVAQPKGVAICGDVHWSPLNNFGSTSGYAQRFGLIAVDRDTSLVRWKPNALDLPDVIVAAPRVYTALFHWHTHGRRRIATIHRSVARGPTRQLISSLRSLAALLAVGSPIAACSHASDGADKNAAIVVVSGKTIAAKKRPAAVPVIVSTPSPPAESPPAAAIRMTPHKSFVDPPLPPELRDDGGLIPLPPPPTANQAAAR